MNANNKEVYIARETREDYHGCGIVLAKEIEYICMAVTGERSFNIGRYDENRMVLGHFWMSSEAKDHQ